MFVEVIRVVKQLQKAEIVMIITLDFSRLSDPIRPLLTISNILVG